MDLNNDILILADNVEIVKETNNIIVLTANKVIKVEKNDTNNIEWLNNYLNNYGFVGLKNKNIVRQLQKCGIFKTYYYFSVLTSNDCKIPNRLIFDKSFYVLEEALNFMNNFYKEYKIEHFFTDYNVYFVAVLKSEYNKRLAIEKEDEKKIHEIFN